MGDRSKEEGNRGQESSKSTPGNGGGRGRGPLVRSNAASGSHSSNEANTNYEAEAREIPGLRGDQIQTLINLLNKKKSSAYEHMSGKNIQSMWIIDSGATNHMTGNRERFSSLRNIPVVAIGLPDGDHVLATMEGVVKLDSKLILDHVLFMPKLKCELISLTRLMDNTDCQVYLTQNLCVIQDHISKNLIRAHNR